MAKVFISYSQADWKDVDGDPINGNAIDKITSFLEKNGIDYWIDRKRLAAGSTYASHITANIKDCEVFLFLSSANSNKSEWTLSEVTLAHEYGKRIIPVRLDHSNYNDGVHLHLAPLQYIDWKALGEKGALTRILAKIEDPEADITSAYESGRIPKLTQIVLYSAITFLTVVYAVLSYQFLMVNRLNQTEAMGGLLGYACEFGVLMSIWYIFRLLRKRRCTFITPFLICFCMALMGVLLMNNDISVLISSGLLTAGWIGVGVSCLVSSTTRKSLLHQMSREYVVMRLSDPEIFLIVYLVIKALVVVIGNAVL